MELKEALKLTVGKEYSFVHKRKGAFRGTLRKIEQTPAGDTSDRVILHVAIDTSVNGRPDLARSRGATVTVTGIRPSLLLRMQEIEYVPPKQQLEEPSAKKRFFEKLFRKG